MGNDQLLESEACLSDRRRRIIVPHLFKTSDLWDLRVLREENGGGENAESCSDDLNHVCRLVA